MALPIAAALAVGSFVVTRGDDTAGPDITAALAQAFSGAGIDTLTQGGPDGSEDARADLSAAQDVAFSASGAAVAAPPSRSALLKLSPTRIRAAAVAALAGAPSAHVVATDATKAGPVVVEMWISKDVADGVLTTPNGKIDIRRLGKVVYSRSDDAVLIAGGVKRAAVDEVHDKWLKQGPGSAGYADIVRYTYLKSWSADLAKVAATGRKVGPALGGIPTVIIFGGRGPTASSTYVASSGPAYPLYSVNKSKTSKIVFDQWGKPVTSEAPPADQVLVVSGR